MKTIAIISFLAAAALSATIKFEPIPNSCDFREVRGDVPNISIIHHRECPAASKAEWHKMTGVDTTVAVPDTARAKK